MKFLAAATAGTVAAVVGFSIYVAYLTVQEERRMAKLQPLLGVAYRR